MTEVAIFKERDINDIQSEIDNACHRFNCEPLSVSITYNSDWREYAVAVIFRKLKEGAE